MQPKPICCFAKGQLAVYESRRTGKSGRIAAMTGMIRNISVKRRPGHLSQGLLTVGGKTHLCALGKGGIRALKREGDGATPLGRMRIVNAWFRADHVRFRSAPIGLTRISGRSGWCDAPDDRRYNQPVELPYPTSHETMRRKDGLYDLVIVLDFNLRPRKRGGGSAIFFHVARPGLMTTEGCVAVPAAVLMRLLPRLTARTVMRVGY
jgi:L,D-peptidoglycan transpeptidase YkuD (ErfK/YbiS/YcfS/YnhG family)